MRRLIDDWRARSLTVHALSPHYDDCVLSCFGALMRTGAPVVTVFAGPPPDDAQLTTWDRLCGGTSAARLHAARAQENRSALSELSVAAVDLAFADGQYRYRADARDLAVAKVRAALEGLGADALIAPAGIGGHEDHVIVREAAAALDVPTLWYAELPYAVLYGWPSYIQPNPYGVDVESDWEQFTTPQAARTALTLELSADEIEQKLVAARTYATQFDVLDARTGGRLSDRECMRHEAYWVDRPF